MADHIEEDEQLEALKRWWAQNGLPIMLAVVMGLGGWFAWQYWQNSRLEKSEAGSLVYQQMMDPVAGRSLSELTEEELASIAELAELLKSEQKGQQYGALAGLMLTKLAVARDDLESAIAELEWVIEEARDDALVDLARLRLVRVLSAAERYDEALEQAERGVGDALSSGLAEARGDIHFLRGDLPAARAAYQTALDALSSQDAMLKPLLEIKLNQVLPAEPELPSQQSEINTVSPGEDEATVASPAAAQPDSADDTEKEVTE